jgi:hypothetical protein
MDAKPFINGNKLTKPDFGYYRPIQNDNIVILAATLEGDDSIEVPPDVEPFIYFTEKIPPFRVGMNQALGRS